MNTTLLASLLFILGILLIVKGGDFFVDAASWIAEASGIPKFIIGATIVSLATTLPELIVSVIAAMDGKADMAVGNAVGSVTANIALIMSISIICIPTVIKRSSLFLKSTLMIVSAALLFILSFKGQLLFLPSITLLVVFAIFIFENVTVAKKSMSNATTNQEKIKGKTFGINILKFVFGAAGIVIGANLLVDNGSILARVIGVPESIIGVTIIAIGTSLPELVTTITAILKKQSSLSIGNILGANIIDLTLILPICSLLSGGKLPISRQSSVLDIPVCLGICVISTLPALISQKFKRWQGVLMIVLYALYVYVLCTVIF